MILVCMSLRGLTVCLVWWSFLSVRFSKFSGTTLIVSDSLKMTCKSVFTFTYAQIRCCLLMVLFLLEADFAFLFFSISVFIFSDNLLMVFLSLPDFINSDIIFIFSVFRLWYALAGFYLGFVIFPTSEKYKDIL